MAVVLEASLNHFTAGELLTLVAAHDRSATLEADSGYRRARLFFREGRLIGAEGGDADSTLIEIAGWSTGTFKVLDSLSVPETVKQVSLEVAPLIAEGERRASEAHRLMAMYATDDVFFTVVPQPQAKSGEMISLRPEEFQILFQIGAGKTLGQLRSEAGRPPVELYAALQKLQSAGLLSATGAAEPTTATPVRPKTRGVTREQRATRSDASLKTTSKQAKPMIGTLTTETGTMHPLLEDETTIGRDERNTIPVPNGSVSSRHARIVRTSEGFFIEDLGSRNGTFVNSEPIRERRLLADSDVVRLGKVLLTFNVAKTLKRRDTTKPEPVP